jgi:integrase
MAKRRQYGTGAVWQDARGTWRGQVRLGGRRYSVSGDTKGQVTNKLKDIRERYEAGDTDPKTAGTPRLGEWLAQWIRDTDDGASANTVANRQWSIGHLSALRDVPIDTLTIDDINALFARKAASLSQSSLNRIRTVLRMALHTARVRGIIDYNPAGSAEGKPLVTIPTRAARTATRRSLSHDAAAALLEVAHGDPAELLIVLGLSLGMRPGEVTGLRWSDVDWDAGTLTVAQMRRREADGTLTFCDPKAGSTRVLGMPEDVAAALRSHEADQRRARMAGKAAYEATGLVVCTRTGQPIDPSNHRRQVARLAKAAGIFWRPTLTPNELRHSCASLRIDAGMSLPAAADLLGHKDLRMVTQTYRHKTRDVVPAPVSLLG